jgi:ferritin-like metal-binding protein YciE
MSADNLREALVEEIKDLYNAEKQLVKALPKMAKGAESDELREAFESHLEETEGQVTRLERVFELLDEKPRGKHCAGMAGIVEEGSEKLQEDMEGSVLDAVLIASAQKVEHYEIGAYGTAIAWAEALGLNEVVTILNETLEEEKAADEKLSALAEAGINQAATQGETEEDEEEMPARSTRQEQPQAGAPAARSLRGGVETSAKSARARGGRR